LILTKPKASSKGEAKTHKKYKHEFKLADQKTRIHSDTEWSQVTIKIRERGKGLSPNSL
jgi:hypothetical protein